MPNFEDTQFDLSATEGFDLHGFIDRADSEVAAGEAEEEAFAD